MRVVVHGLLGSEEVTRECEWEEVQALMQDIQDHRPDWRAITVVHIEDFPTPDGRGSEAERHAKHSLDGYPLCWALDQDGPFQATSQDGLVTCQPCRAILRSYE